MTFGNLLIVSLALETNGYSRIIVIGWAIDWLRPNLQYCPKGVNISSLGFFPHLKHKTLENEPIELPLSYQSKDQWEHHLNEGNASCFLSVRRIRRKRHDKELETT